MKKHHVTVPAQVAFLLLLTVLLFSFQQKSRFAAFHNVRTADTGIIADGATPQLISKQFSFTEGPAVDKKGNVFFTDQPNNKIWKYDTDGKLSVFLDNAGRSNGMYFDKK